MLQGIHHAAYRCRDAQETVAFYKQALDMDLLLAISEDRVPSTKAPDPYMHIFLDAGRGNVLSSGLKLWMYAWGDVRRMLEGRFRIERLDVLNHTVFPFNMVLPGASLWLAHKLARTTGAPAWLRWLSSDLLVRLSAKA